LIAVRERSLIVMRPLVIGLFSVSWDGRVVAIGEPEASAELREKRRRFFTEALEGADAVVFDAARAREGMTLATGHGKLPVLACLDGHLEACAGLLQRDSAGAVSVGAPLVYAPRESLAVAGGEWAGPAELRLCGVGEVDLWGMLESLASDYGVRRLVCAGGGDLWGRLLSMGCVGELCLNHRPQILGNKTGETASGLGTSFLPESVRASLRSVKHFEGECFTRWGLKFGREFSERVDSCGRMT